MKQKIFRELTVYWLLVLVVYFIEGIIHQGKLALSLVFIVNLAPIFILSNFLMRSYGLTLSISRYVIASAAVIVLAIFNNSLNLAYTTLAMPIALVACFPFVEGIYATFVTKKNEANFIQKLLASIVFTSGILCCLNYAINRMTPGTELLGFGTGFLTYITASIILPVFTIQEINREKTQRLELLVKERTDELLTSNVQKEKLLRVVVHDISNALQALIFHTSRLSLSSDPKVTEVSAKMLKNITSISDITHHVRELERSKSRPVKLLQVGIQDCLDEIKELFIERYNKKNIHLHLVNKAPLDVCIKVERVMFVHSVLSNIISNALKFSHPGSEVILNVYESKGVVYFDTLDYGTGMNAKMLSNLFEHEIAFSVPGTSGERGSGLGMPLVKNYTELFGGQVQAFSTTGVELSGTRIVVSLPASFGNVENMIMPQVSIESINAPH
jgi:signal transduction histidine kinase